MAVIKARLLILILQLITDLNDKNNNKKQENKNKDVTIK